MIIKLTFPGVYDNRFKEYIERIKPIAEWVDDQDPKIKWSYERIEQDQVWSFEFSHPGQAVMFKLLWGGK